MNVYKYMGRAASKCFLTDLTIRFSQPAALNDPFELSPELYFFDSSLVGLDNVSISYALIGGESIVSKYLVHPNSNRVHLNSVDLKDQLKQLSSLIGVLSLTRDEHHFPRNSLMWAHYSESHSGIAIKLKNDCDYVVNSHKVNYVGCRPIIDAKMIAENSIIPIGDLFFKSESWKYENEIRAIKKLEDCIPTGNQDPFGFGVFVSKVDPSMVDCIFVGANAEASLKELAIELFHKSGIDVVFLGVDKGSYSLRPYTFLSTKKSYGEIIELTTAGLELI